MRETHLTQLQNPKYGVNSLLNCLHYLSPETELVRIYEPRREKTGLRGFRPGPTQTGLYKLRKELEA